jgi:sugar phosphate isomerase/epimerase
MRIFVLAHSLKRTRARRRLSLSDLACFVVDCGFAGLEVSDRQFAGCADADMRLFAAACAQAGCALIFDVNADLTTPAGERRDAEIAHARSMIFAAGALGAERLRICVGGQTFSMQKFFRRRRARPAADLSAPPDGGAAAMCGEKCLMRMGHWLRENLPAHVRGQEEKIERAAAALGPLAADAGACRIPVGIENHWGISGDPANIVRIIRAVASPWLGSCPDLGNFPRKVDAVAGLRLLAEHAVLLHAKSYRFDSHGRETRIDYPGLLPLFHEAGFAGPVTVEFEGFGDDLEGCLKTRDLLRRCWPAIP